MHEDIKSIKPSSINPTIHIGLVIILSCKIRIYAHGGALLWIHTFMSYHTWLHWRRVSRANFMWFTSCILKSNGGGLYHAQMAAVYITQNQMAAVYITQIKIYGGGLYHATSNGGGLYHAKSKRRRSISRIKWRRSISRKSKYTAAVYITRNKMVASTRTIPTLP